MLNRIKQYFRREDQAHREAGEQNEAIRMERQQMQTQFCPLCQVQNQRQGQPSDRLPPGHRLTFNVNTTCRLNLSHIAPPR